MLDKATMSYQKILVSLDRSDQASAVFAPALEIATQFQSQLLLFHCLSWETEEQINPLVGVGTLGDVNLYSHSKLQQLRHESLQKDLQQVKEWLDTYSQQAVAKNLVVETEGRVGSPGSWICERAGSWGANLIVIGRRGHRGLAELLLGSVSNYVVHHAPCSVLVVHQENESGK